jgi:hypothetical protein
MNVLFEIVIGIITSPSVVYFLVSIIAENRGLIKESGVGTKLIELLRNPLEDIQRNAAGTITNLCSVNGTNDFPSDFYDYSSIN